MGGKREYMIHNNSSSNNKQLPLRMRLDRERTRTKIQMNIIEQDYLLSWILYGISMVAELKENLAFKGGTALKKCYFGEYRFSEDLDYSFVGEQNDTPLLEERLRQACDIAMKGMELYMPNPKIIISQYREKKPHPDGQLAYIVRGQLPWHREPRVKAMVEITMNEAIITPLRKKNIIHNYGEVLEAEMFVYSLEEIIAEKLRAILQYTKKLHEQGWARSRCRDYYDLWSIFNSFNAEINYSLIRNALERKCLKKNISFASIDDFFQPITITEVTNTWSEWLRPLVMELPSAQLVLENVKDKLKTFLFI